MHHPHPNRTFIILILGALSTISPFAIDMYLPAFPQVAAGLHTDTPMISLSISSYFAGLAAAQLFYGPLLDRFGRKLPLSGGLLLFVAASLLCAASKSVQWLIAMRALQAIGGCAAQVASMAMVRDFFPVHETAKIISLLILILGVSPLLAPAFGGYVSENLGWQWVFVILAIVAFVNLVVCHWWLPEGHPPDRTVSLEPASIFRNFWAVLKEAQFLTYSVSGAFAFSGLLAYVAGSPIIFLEVFHVKPFTFEMIFAGLAVGFIGSNQVNVLLLRKFSSEQIYRYALLVECVAATIFFAGTIFGWFGLWPTLGLLFIVLTSLGLAYPNAAALALAVFDTNIGSASAMLGFLQIGVSGLASASIGILKMHGMLPVVVVLFATSWVAMAILIIGKRSIPKLKFVEEKGAMPVAH